MNDDAHADCYHINASWDAPTQKELLMVMSLSSSSLFSFFLFLLAIEEKRFFFLFFPFQLSYDRFLNGRFLIEGKDVRLIFVHQTSFFTYGLTLKRVFIEIFRWRMKTAFQFKEHQNKFSFHESSTKNEWEDFIVERLTGLCSKTTSPCIWGK